MVRVRFDGGARGLAVDFSGANPVIYATNGGIHPQPADYDRTRCCLDCRNACDGDRQLIFRGVAFAPLLCMAPSGISVTGGGATARAAAVAIVCLALNHRQLSTLKKSGGTITRWLPGDRHSGAISSAPACADGYTVVATRFVAVATSTMTGSAIGDRQCVATQYHSRRRRAYCAGSKRLGDVKQF